ncbi:MAG: DUF814 domain-containing protein, partial [Bacteroidia bacterium]|nr:DUF814 domain-containing protein [Bacteroidia bacterium]
LNYNEAISHCSVPVVGHEISQFEIYPNYDEIKKYNGVLKPWNLEIFRQRIIEAGMADQAYDFFKASGAASMLCYRADIEMALRTPGFGGFQLLDLQDFPGQGSALVGILDAFMDSKGLITPEEFSQFCNRVVPLMIADKYCWENSEKFLAKIQVANFSEKALTNQNILWELLDQQGKTIEKGSTPADLPQGKLTDAATVEFSLSGFNAAQKLTLRIMLEGTAYTNSYPIWVYPRMETPAVTGEILVSEKLDTEVLKIGRHLYLDEDQLLVIGRNHNENVRLQELAREDDYLIKVYDRPGPLGLLRLMQGEGTAQLSLAARIIARYSDARQENTANIKISRLSGDEKVLQVVPLPA